MRPIQRPLAFSITENMLKPCIVHAPAIVRKPRHAAARGCAPPMKRADSSSAMNAAQASKSSRAIGRRIRRGVSMRIVSGDTRSERVDARHLAADDELVHGLGAFVGDDRFEVERMADRA